MLPPRDTGLKKAGHFLRGNGDKYCATLMNGSNACLYSYVKTHNHRKICDTSVVNFVIFNCTQPFTTSNDDYPI